MDTVAALVLLHCTIGFFPPSGGSTQGHSARKFAFQNVKVIKLLCMYTSIYAQDRYVYNCMRACMDMDVIDVCMYVCLYVCMYVGGYVRMYARMYVRMYVCMYVCIFS